MEQVLIALAAHVAVVLLDLAVQTLRRRWSTRAVTVAA